MYSEAKVVQRKEFRLIGLSRSGNHAIINWMIRQLEGTYCFLNCTEPKYNPYTTIRPLSREGSSFRTNIPGFELPLEQKGVFSQKDFLLYNHEDCFLGAMNKTAHRQQLREWVGDSQDRKDILILRDPFNLFASRIKAGFIRGFHTHNGEKPIPVKTLLRIYKQHAREFLGRKNYLRDKVLVSFNSWASDKEYRKGLTEALGIKFSDEGFREVPSVAGGSSFDGTALSGNAHKMGVNSRWLGFLENEDYWNLFDEELVELAWRIFGDLPAIEYAQQRGLIKDT